MRSLTLAGVLVLAASVVACSDSLTGPELSDGMLQSGRDDHAPDCIRVPVDGPNSPGSGGCAGDAPPPDATVGVPNDEFVPGEIPQPGR